MEQKVLGAIMININGFMQIHKILTAEMFFEKSHQEIFKAMAGLFAAQKPVKKVMISQSIGDELGGISTDAILSAMEHTAINEEIIPLDLYSQAIQEAWVKRDGSDFFKKLAETIQKPGINVEDVLNRAKSKLTSFSGSTAELVTTTLSDAIDTHINRISERRDSGSTYGYDTGVKYINDLIGNVCPGQYIIIGAGTKTGKTAMTIEMGLGLAEYGPVLCFSPEMMSGLLAAREIASKTGISTMRQRSQNLTSYDFDAINSARKSIKSADNFHVISKKKTIEEIFDFVRAFKAKHGNVVAVIVDHLGILKPLKGGGRKDFEIAMEASPIMKEIAEELNCVSFGLSQLNKETPYGRTIKEKINFCSRPPNYHDLKGAIANDADHVIMPYRKEAVLSNIEPAKGTEDYLLWENEMNEAKGKGHVRLALSREVPYPKTIPLYWVGERTRFESMEQVQDDFYKDPF